MNTRLLIERAQAAAANHLNHQFKNHQSTTNHEPPITIQ
jgi:hypothetical protein